ncbi:MAG TPA: nucleotidyltransferase family protein [Syntrophorhabdaceae bacterium]|nr:nucleotidyltransferase family protein [Syntrophorhabdaceae bacterium]
MKNVSLKTIVDHLQKNKQLLYERYGVTSIGIFGSIVRGEHTPSSDIDIVVEMEADRKNIHSFLQLKRYLEKETSRKVDLGFEHALKPVVKKMIKGQIVYV